MATSTTHALRAPRSLAALNDRFRRTGLGGQIVITRGIAQLGNSAVAAIHACVRSFDAFSPDNDPYGEHDFGAFDWAGRRLFWKISYYDPTLRFGSADPTDPALTCRVLTIMLAEEY
ncbi:DUF3768 domain-containing protein [Sphingomonas sp. 1P08PE]|uniref:DUF3768 domain-containing protein n=1 Tax=Sphingomonas sp. 1P08PE TaxID=554122 RepID=UPI0039A17950